MILIEKDGEQQLVNTLEGYDGWTVINADAGIPLSALREAKQREVDLYLEQQFLAGFSPRSGPLVGHTLQVRNDTDRTNWLTSKDAYRDAIDAGFGNVVDADFRTAENETIVCTYQEGFDTLQEMAAWGKALMGRSWALKDAITLLTSADAIQSYDVSVEWGE